MIAPPYDVVGAADEAALLARSPYNAAHLELCPGDERDRYRLARENLERWIEDGVLIREDTPAYYVYEQRALVQGEQITRRSIFAALRLHSPEDGIVRPHEATMSAPREQRLRLLRATRTNVSPIFATFPDDERRARRVLDAPGAEPDFEAVDSLGERHSLWVIRGHAAVGALSAALEGVKATIADGHHRYATALSYLAERLEAEPSLPDDTSERFVLAGLIPEDDPGLVILPNHRLVNADPPADFLQRLGALYDVEPVEGWGIGPLRELWRRVRDAADGPATFGFVEPRAQRLRLLRGRSASGIDEAMPQHLSPASRALAARVLTETVLRPHLGIDDDALADDRRVTFSESAEDAWERAASEGRVAFLLNPTRVSEVAAVADAGELMPQKTTYYYPKLATGLVFRSLDNE